MQLVLPLLPPEAEACIWLQLLLLMLLEYWQ
jgi:hypothetical protein